MSLYVASATRPAASPRRRRARGPRPCVLFRTRTAVPARARPRGGSPDWGVRRAARRRARGRAGRPGRRAEPCRRGGCSGPPRRRRRPRTTARCCRSSTRRVATGGAASTRTGDCQPQRPPGAAAGAARRPKPRAARSPPATSASAGGPVRPAGRRLRDTRGPAAGRAGRADLVSTVAHEIRSPLTTVKGFTSTLLAKWDRLADEQKLAMLAAVNADADRVTRLLADLLDASRIDAGRLRLRPQVVDVPAVVAPGASPARVAAGDRTTGSRWPGRRAAGDLARPGPGRPGPRATWSRTRSGTAPARSRVEIAAARRRPTARTPSTVTVATRAAGSTTSRSADLLPVLARGHARRHRTRPVHRQGHRRGPPRRDRGRRGARRRPGSGSLLPAGPPRPGSRDPAGPGNPVGP